MSRILFTAQYFDRYLERGKITHRLKGDNWYFYRYWASYLRQNLPPEARVAEVGCGLGFFARYIDERFSYTGLDVSLDALAWAKERNRIASVINGTAESLPFRAETFEAVVAFDLVEHLDNPELFFNETRRVLKRRGILVFTTPNVYSFGVKQKSKSESLTASMYTDQTHVSLLPPDTWLQMIGNAGFTIVTYGTDTLWDIPYFRTVPVIIQKVLLIPINMLATLLFGFFPWRQGENLVIVCKK